MRKLSYVALWAFVFTVPLENAFVFFGGTTIAKLVGIAAFGVGMACVVTQGSLRKLDSFHYLFGLFVAWIVASYFWSIWPEGTIRQIVTFAQLFGMVWLIWEFAREREKQVGLLKAYLFGAYVAVFTTFAQYAMGATYASGLSDRYATAGFNPNDIGNLLVLGLPVAWYLASLERRRVYRWGYLAYMGLSLVAVMLTGSRGSLIAAGPALLIVPLSYRKLSWRRRFAIGGLLLGALYAAVAYVPDVTWKRMETINTEIAGGDFGARGEIWKAGLEVFPDHPVFGVGAGAYYEAMIPYFNRGVAAHSVYLNVLVSLGLVGILLFALLFGTASMYIVKMRGMERIFWFVWILTLAIVIMPRNWFYRKPIWLILGLLCAWGAATRQERRSKKTHLSHHY